MYIKTKFHPNSVMSSQQLFLVQQFSFNLFLVILFSFRIAMQEIWKYFVVFVFTFFLPADFANNAVGISSGLSPLTEKSRLARSCSVPPHFIPSDVKVIFSSSNPKLSSSSALL